MGVDIYGISPKLNSEEPVRIDHMTATEEQRDAYYVAMENFQEENPGYYFRANWWSWRPIHLIADLAIKVADLPLSTKGWGSNDGDGLKTQLDCDLLADAMDMFIILNKKEMSEDNDRIYICMGAWVRQDGTFINADLEEQLSEEHPLGTVMYSGVVDSTGTLAFSAHSVSLDYIKEFITFLRNCGGFEIH